MRKSELTRRITEDAVRMSALSSQMDGTRKLYEACSLLGDQAGCERHRESLHSILDMQLDLRSTTSLLIRSFGSSEE